MKNALLLLILIPAISYAQRNQLKWETSILPITPGTQRVAGWNATTGSPTSLTLGVGLTISGGQISLSGGSLSDGDKGDITVSGSGATWTIDNSAVTYSKLQNISATSRFLGRITAGAGVTEELTGTQATTLLDVFTSGLKGLAPASGGGSTNFLRADGAWAAPSGVTNSGAANELVKSNGTNIVGTGLFTSSDGFLTRTGNFNLTTTGDITLNTANGVGAQSLNANNNTVYNTFTVDHQTTGTPAAGIGAAVKYNVETSVGNVESIARIVASINDATSTSEDGDLIFETMTAGATADQKFKIGSNYSITLPSIDGAPSSLTNAMMWYNNNATDPSLGARIAGRTVDVVYTSGSNNPGAALYLGTDPGFAQMSSLFKFNDTNPGYGLTVGQIQQANEALNIYQVENDNPVMRYATLGATGSPSQAPSVLIYQDRVLTTDATVTTLRTVAIPASTTVMLVATITGRRTGGSSGTAEDNAAYILSGLYRNVGGTATLTGAVATIFQAESQAGFTAQFTASGGNVLIQVQGALDNNMTWHLEELKYMTVTD